MSELELYFIVTLGIMALNFTGLSLAKTVRQIDICYLITIVAINIWGIYCIIHNSY